MLKWDLNGTEHFKSCERVTGLKTEQHSWNAFMRHAFEFLQNNPASGSLSATQSYVALARPYCPTHWTQPTQTAEPVTCKIRKDTKMCLAQLKWYSIWVGFINEESWVKSCWSKMYSYLYGNGGKWSVCCRLLLLNCMCFHLFSFTLKHQSGPFLLMAIIITSELIHIYI